MVSPVNGAVCPTGAHPGNTGGKPGRSGRPPNELREALRSVVDEHGIDFIRGIIAGRAEVTLTGRCEHCGKVSKGPASTDDMLAAVPTIDNRLRAFDGAAKYGLGERSEYSEDVVTENLDKMLQLAETLMEKRDYGRYVAAVDEIWNARNA